MVSMQSVKGHEIPVMHKGALHICDRFMLRNGGFYTSIYGWWRLIHGNHRFGEQQICYTVGK